MKLLEQITGKRVQVTCVTEEQIDVESLMDIAAMEIDELMSIEFDENVIYSCSNFVNLSKRLEKPINRFDFHMIIAQVAHMHKIAKKLKWKTADVLWNPDYVYMSPTTREVKFIYLPNNDIENNSITDMLERIIYSAIQSNDEDTYLSEFVYYLKRLGAFSSEEIIEFVMEQDSKVTRLLQLKKPITYTKPIRSILKPEVEAEEQELEIPDFETIKVEPEEVVEEAQEESDSIPDVHFNVQDVMDSVPEPEEQEPEEIAEAVITEVPEEVTETEEFIPEEVEVEQAPEEEAVEETVVEEEAQTAQPRLSFSDLFSEDIDLHEESYFDVDLENDNIHLEEEFEPLKVEEIEVVEEPNIEEIIKEVPEEVEEEMVVEDPVDLTPSPEEEELEVVEEVDDEDESTQEMFLKQEDIEEPELPKGYITRLSNEQKAVIDLPEFIIGKSSFVNGMVVKGNPGVSRKHAMIHVDDGHYYIRDLDSVNGTYINDAFVEPETEVEILNGDSIKLGDEEFTFTIE